MVKLLKLSVGGNEPPVNADRIDLAAAIADIKRIERALAERQAVVARAHEMVGHALKEQDEAEADVESARNTLRLRMVEAAHSGRTVGLDAAMSAAHARLAASNESLAAAQAALAFVRDAGSSEESELEDADLRRQKAIRNLVDGRIDPLHAEVIELRDRFMAKMLELRFAAGIAYVWPPTARNKVLDDLFQWPVSRSPYACLTTDPQAEPVVSVWREAIENLKTDASTPLPGEGAKK